MSNPRNPRSASLESFRALQMFDLDMSDLSSDSDSGSDDDLDSDGVKRRRVEPARVEASISVEQLSDSQVFVVTTGVKPEDIVSINESFKRVHIASSNIQARLVGHLPAHIEELQVSNSIAGMFSKNIIHALPSTVKRLYLPLATRKQALEAITANFEAVYFLPSKSTSVKREPAEFAKLICEDVRIVNGTTGEVLREGKQVQAAVPEVAAPQVVEPQAAAEEELPPVVVVQPVQPAADPLKEKQDSDVTATVKEIIQLAINLNGEEARLAGIRVNQFVQFNATINTLSMLPFGTERVFVPESFPAAKIGAIPLYIEVRKQAGGDLLREANSELKQLYFIENNHPSIKIIQLKNELITSIQALNALSATVSELLVDALKLKGPIDVQQALDQVNTVASFENKLQTLLGRLPVVEAPAPAPVANQWPRLFANQPLPKRWAARFELENRK